MSYKSEFQSNNIDLQSILSIVQSLPDGAPSGDPFIPTNSGGTSYKSRFGDNNIDLRRMLEYIQNLGSDVCMLTVIGWEGHTYSLTKSTGGAAPSTQYGAVWIFEVEKDATYTLSNNNATYTSNITIVDTLTYHIVPTTLGYTSVDTGYTHGIKWKNANTLLDSLYMKDPFIMLADGIYFMYGSNLWSPELGNAGFSCYLSSDKENWLGPYDLTAGTVDWTGYEHFWSPELTSKHGWYYMVVCCKKVDTNPSDPTENHGIKILASQSPIGKFYDITLTTVGNGFLDKEAMYATAEINMNSLDPSFWQDANVHLFWCDGGDHSNGDSDTIYTGRFNADIQMLETTPYQIIDASQISWGDGYVCCAPFVLPYQVNNKVVMLFGAKTAAGDRVIGQAYAPTIAGPWVVVNEPLVTGDVGSPCIFYTKDGTMMLSYHNNAQNDPNQRAEIVQVEWAGANPWLRIKT